MNYSTPITPPSTGGGGTGTVNKITFNGVEFLPDPTGNVPIDYQGFSGAYADLTGKPILFSGNYSDLTGSPVLAAVATSGSYNDLTEKPVIPAAQVNSDWNATTGVAQILNKPTIPTVPTNVSAFINDAGYLDSTDIAPVGLSGNYADLLNKPDLSPLATAIQNASNVGTATSLVSGKTGTNLDFRTLRAGDNVTLSVNAQGEIVIASAGGGTVSGEANTSSSLGAGVSIVAPKDGVDLPFRSLLSSAGLTWSQETNTVTLTLHSILRAWANLTLAADTLVYATGAGTLGTTPLTAFARTLLDDANAAAMQNTLALALVASSGSYADLSNKPDLTVYAPKESPTFTGDPKAPTAAATDNDTSIATTAFVRAAMALFGLGTSAAPIMPEITNFSQHWPTGMYHAAGDGAAAPTPNAPPGSGNNRLLVLALNYTNTATQYFVISNSATAAGKKAYFGNYYTGTATQWVEATHSGNFDPTTKQDKSTPITTATTRTLALADAWNYICPANSSAITLTVPTNASVAFPIGTEITIRAAGTANVTIAAASGVTILAPANGTLVLSSRMTAVLKQRLANTWDLIGQTVPA